MALSIGDRLGPYEVLSSLGEGGMGVVFRARDSRLNRDVALKVLPDSFAADPDRLARFQREAQVLAALNHPNIAAIYGIEESGSRGPGVPESSTTRALVMELVEGMDLSGAIRSGRFSGRDGLTEAREVARQIAGALEAAHDAGIVHRDLKPANIRLRPDGTVKVLDFGLARTLDAGLGTADPLNSPTMTTPAMTQAGMIMGTAAYMSPEQARGRPVDRRADIWAFGCVLYEMVTGTAIFVRDSVTDMLAAITRDEPEWGARPDLPPDLIRLLKRCLDKDPRTRLRDIGEARIMLSGDGRIEQAIPDTTVAATSRVGLGPWVAASVLIAAAASAVTWWIVSSKPAAGAPQLAATISRVTSDSGLTTNPAVAPNGSLLAYASDRGGGSLNIWVQPLPDGQPVQVTHDDVDASDPSFSPDGSRIVYRSERNGGGLYVVPALGGAARFVVAKGRNPRFSPDGKQIAYSSGGRGAGSELWVIEEGGGAPRRLATDLQRAGAPVWSPDGRFILTDGVQRSGADTIVDWWLVDLQSGPPSRVAAFERLKLAGLESGPDAWVGNEIIFSAASGDVSSVWAIDISADGRTVTGVPRRLTAGVGADISPSVITNAEGLTVYYANKDERANVYRLGLSASRGAAGLERVTDAAATDWWPSLSSDGRTLLFGSNRSGGEGVWLRDLASGRESPLIAAGSGAIPTISPDGQRMAYATSRNASRKTVLRAVGGGSTEPLHDDVFYAWSWPSDRVLFGGRRSGEVNELLVVDPATRQHRPVLADLKKGFYGHGQLSPDGRWASAMEWSSADRARIILFPFRDAPVPPAEWVPLTGDQTVEEEHVWSPKGDAIYFVSERDGTRCVWMRKLDSATKRPIGSVESVVHLHGARRSMISTSSTPQRVALAADALFFSVQEVRANIWKAALKGK